MNNQSDRMTVEGLDLRPSILAIIRANRHAGESQEVLARDLTTLFNARILGLTREIEDANAEILRLVDALVYAHEMGVEWPSDPLPFGSIAHNLFIERGNDPERIAALNASNERAGE
jgi:hypothetical protein